MPTNNPTVPSPQLASPKPAGLVAALGAWLIALYQRYISPRKGFRCAHRVLHGGQSCSEFIGRMVLERGVLPAAREARGRFADCREARNTLRAAQLSAADADVDSADDSDDSDEEGQHAPWYYNVCDGGCDCGLTNLFGGKGAGAADPAGDAAGGCGDALPADCCGS